MRQADLTFEMPPAGADSGRLESYAVFDADGEPLGKVLTVIQPDGQMYLVVERSPIPLKHDLWALPFDEIATVDDQNLGVVLGLRRDELEEHALGLDRAQGMRNERAEAPRVTEPPPQLVPAPAVEDTALKTLSSFLWASVGLSALGVAAVYTVDESPLVLAFLVIPLGLVAATIVYGHRRYASRR